MASVILLMPITSYGKLNLEDLIKDQTKALKENRLTDAIDYGKIALSMYRSGESDTILWHALDIAGNACVNTRRYIEALDFYMAAIEFGDKNVHNRSKTIGLNNIGNIYETFGDYEGAAHYLTLAYTNACANNDSYMAAASLLNLVNVHSQLGNIDKARAYFQELRKYSLRSRLETSIWRSLSKISIDLASGDYKAAVTECRKVKAMASSFQYKKEIENMTYNRMAKAYSGLQRDDSVAFYSRIIIEDPMSLSSFPDLLADAYLQLSGVYARKEFKDSADKYKLLYIQLSDSIFNHRKFNAARDLIVRYEDGKVQSHIFDLNDRIRERNIWIAIAMTAFLAAIAVGLYIYFSNRRLHSANEVLISKNRDLMSEAKESQRLREQLVALYSEVNSYKEQESSDNNAVLDESQTTESIADGNPTGSYELSEQQVVVILNDITRVMKDPDIICDSTFSLATLAQLVHSNTNYVSIAINRTYQKNFKTYLNEFRIQLAAERLLDNKTLTIQAIAESSGFKSASNFITAFKKVMGMNPSTYRKHGGLQMIDKKD